jgi:hypothetical protein
MLSEVAGSTEAALLGHRLDRKITHLEESLSRLVVKLIFSALPGLWGWATRHILPAGDLLMMRKQLHTLKALTERDARPPTSGG